jgi:uncharacterized protein (DUF2336 family)
MQGALTPGDVARLLQEPRPAVRAEVAAKVARAIESDPLSADELSLAQDIARLLARDLAVTVRRSLSDSLRRASRLPHDVALRLAADVEAVSLPVLSDSPVLTDANLLEILRHASPAQQQAIAGRPSLAEPVCDAISDTAEEPAVVVLLRNPGAQIGAGGFGRAIERFPHSDRVKSSMVQRATLPIGIAERLVTLVSDRLRDYLVSHHALPAETASDIVLHGRERALLHLARGSGREELLRLVRGMHRHRRLTPSLVLRAVCSGDMAFFVSALAAMAQVPVGNAELLVNDAGGRGLLSLYERAGLPARLLPAVRAAVAVARGTGLDGGEHDLERYRARVASRVLTQCEELDPEDAAWLLDRIPLTPAVRPLP